MSGSEARTWAFAVCFSLGVHGALLWQVRTLDGESGHGTPSPTVTRVRFNTTRAAPSKMNAVTETKPRPKPVAEKAPAVATMPVAEPEPEVSEEQESDEQVASLAPLSGSEASSATVPGAASIAELRQAYHSQLMAHIEGKKFYPETARRRGVTGGVRVGFIVAPGGSASALECSQGPGVLVQAACEAVRRAVPLPMPPPELQLPFSVSFVMDYSLK
jgi:protein TonB